MSVGAFFFFFGYYQDELNKIHSTTRLFIYFTQYCKMPTDTFF